MVKLGDTKPKKEERKNCAGAKRRKKKAVKADESK